MKLWKKHRAVIAMLVAVVLTAGVLVVNTAAPAMAKSSCSNHRKSCCPYPAITELDGTPLARCYTPGDDAEWGAALYMCDQDGLFNAVWATPWQDVKACMDADLAVNGTNIQAVRAHFVEIYIFSRGKKQVERFWRDAYRAAITFLTNARKYAPWIHRMVTYGAPVLCTGVGALVAGAYGAAASAIGCSWAIQYLLNKEGL